MLRGLVGVAIGLALIVGGLSGNLVLIGTDSGGALAVVGVIIAGIGVFRVVAAARADK